MYRRTATWCILLLFVTGTWTATSQETPPRDEAVIEDPAGDVVIRTQDGTTTEDPGEYDEYDILTASMRMENATHLRLDMKLAENPETFGGMPRFHFFFTFGGLAYRVQPNGCRGGPFALHAATSLGAPDTAWWMVKCLEGYDFRERPEADLTAYVPAKFIQDANGGPLRGGTEIEEFYAATHASFSFGVWTASDRAPDAGTVAGIRLPVDESSARAGFQMSSPFPVQFSNGGAGTILFHVVFDNLADEETALLLGVSGARADWKVLLPDRVVLDSGVSVPVPILVNVPFSHTHGATDAFDLFAANENDPAARTSLHLAVHYPLVPQPAGHHPTLYLHSDDAEESSRVLGWMNPRHTALDPGASYQPASPSRSTLNDTHAEARWTLPLNPALRIGLAFDHGREGFFKAAIVPGVPVVDATVRTTLLLCDPGPGEDAAATADCGVGTWRVLGTGEPVQITGNAGQVLDIEQTIDFSEAPRRYDYARQANLFLRVIMQRGPGEPGWFVDESTTGLVTNGSYLEVPFLEYGHPLGAEYQAARSLTIAADKPTFRLVNPGKTLSFNITVENTGKDYQDVRLRAEGHNAAWARFRSVDPVTTLEPGASWTEELLVTAPAVASADEFAELTILAQDPDDSASVALLGLRVLVTTSQPIADEFHGGSDAAGPTEPSPHPGALSVAILFVLLGVGGRRFRKL